MRVVLVGAPGATATRHWSDAFAGDLAREFIARGANVEWLRFAPADVSAHGLVQRDVRTSSPAPLHRVAAGTQDSTIESALVASLRANPATAVVHVGVGARGSPNILWLADRMGSTPFAVVRSSEIVCHRGDLIHATGLACATFDDASRCCECCAKSKWRRPRPADLHNRWDLLIAGLYSSAAVFVAEEVDCERLAASGVPRRTLCVTQDPRVIGARVLGSLVAT